MKVLLAIIFFALNIHFSTRLVLFESSYRKAFNALENSDTEKDYKLLISLLKEKGTHQHSRLKILINPTHPLLEQAHDAICYKLNFNRSLIIMSEYKKETFFHEMGHCLLDEAHHLDTNHIMHESALNPINKSTLDILIHENNKSIVFYLDYYISLFLTIVSSLFGLIALIYLFTSLKDNFNDSNSRF